MMFSEFQEGTGCRDNEYNHEVFRNLEAMYMNTDMSKADVYEYGKKLVDNSKTEEELQMENEYKKQIEELKAEIKYERERKKMYEEFYKEEKNETWKREIKCRKENIRYCRLKISEIKWVLGE